ncbi:hypothetical protein HDV05_000685 [Chytridiales sp. JEL 0842]|nr:hypothetical protein HDV05_000685 [Chytridiales sp. JEL 0842]
MTTPSPPTSPPLPPRTLSSRPRTETFRTKGSEGKEEELENVRMVEEGLKELEISLSSLTSLSTQLSAQLSATTSISHKLSKLISSLPKSHPLHSQFKSLQSQLPPTPTPRVLTWLLGPNFPVWIPTPDLKRKYKTSTESFKLTASLLLTSFSLLLLLLPPTSPFSRLLDSCGLVWCVGYYTSLTLRDTLLKSNGTPTPRWSTPHHLLSILLSFTLIASHPLLPPHFRSLFLLLTTLIGCTQHLQYRTQKRRLYVLVSLAKKTPMESLNGDGTTLRHLDLDFLVLLPFVWGVQGLQGYLGWWAVQVEGLRVVGGLLLVLAGGNAVVTGRSFLMRLRGGAGKRER